MTLYSNKIEVDNYKTITAYSTNEITQIACNDALTKDGFPKGKLSIDFKDKAGCFISMTLVDYSHSEEIMNTLLNYENIKFDVTNFTSNPEVLDIEEI